MSLGRMVNAYIRRKQLEQRAQAIAFVNALSEALGQGKDPPRRVPARAFLRMTGAGI